MPAPEAAGTAPRKPPTTEKKRSGLESWPSYSSCEGRFLVCLKTRSLNMPKMRTLATRLKADPPCQQHSTCHPSVQEGSPRGTDSGEGTDVPVAGQTRLAAPGY